MSNGNRHHYDKQCGCNDCTSHELALQYSITAEPELQVVPVAPRKQGVLSQEHVIRTQILNPIVKR